MTRQELVELLNEEGISPNTYSLDGDLLPNRIILYKNYNFWEIFYLDEKGNKKILKRCRNENDAYSFVHLFLIEDLLSFESIYYSKPPVIIPETVKLFKKVSSLELATRIWFDSIITEKLNWPNDAVGAVFAIEMDKKHFKNYIIRLYGTISNINSTKKDPGAVAVIPLYDFISIKSKKDGTAFANDFIDVLEHVLIDKSSAYFQFFGTKSIYVALHHIIVKMTNPAFVHA